MALSVLQIMGISGLFSTPASLRRLLPDLIAIPKSHGARRPLACDAVRHVANESDDLGFDVVLPLVHGLASVCLRLPSP